MIREILKYIDYFLIKTKKQHPEINDVIIKSSLVYQYLYLKHFRRYISVNNILKLNNNEIGLIGPGNGCITWFL